MDNETPLLAFAWTFVLALAVGAIVNRLMWKRWNWPRTGLIALGLAMARAVIVFFDPPFLFALLILVILLGACVMLANLLFPQKPAADNGNPN